jgi:ribosome-binding factor A
MMRMSKRHSSGKASGRDRGAVRPHSQRQLRVGEEMRHLIAALIERGDMRDPELRGVSITVTSVDVSPDLRNAIAFVMPLGGQDEQRMLAALRRAAPWFRGRVGEQAQLRYAPEIRFELDRSFDAADRIGSLLRRPDVAGDIKKPDPPKDD